MVWSGPRILSCTLPRSARGWDKCGWPGRGGRGGAGRNEVVVGGRFAAGFLRPKVRRAVTALAEKRRAATLITPDTRLKHQASAYRRLVARADDSPQSLFLHVCRYSVCLWPAVPACAGACPFRRGAGDVGLRHIAARKLLCEVGKYLRAGSRLLVPCSLID